MSAKKSPVKRFVLDKYPLKIEPLVNVLECYAWPLKGNTVGNASEPANGRHWLRLARWVVEHDTFWWVIENDMAQWFGDAEKPEDGSVAIAYDSAGVKSYIAERGADGRWLRPYRFNDEERGQPLLRPSVRLVFSDPGDVASVANLFETLRREPSRPARRRDLDEFVRVVRRGLAEPPRVLAVAGLADEKRIV